MMPMRTDRGAFDLSITPSLLAQPWLPCLIRSLWPG